MSDPRPRNLRNDPASSEPAQAGQTQTPGSQRQPRLHGWASKLLWPLLALAVLLIFNFFFSPGFFDIVVRDGRLYGSLIDILDRAAPVMLLSLGMTLVIATGGVDLSVGAIMAIAGTVAAWLLADQGSGAFVAILVPVLACAVAGAWNGALVAWAGVQPIVATLILMVAGRGVAQLLSQGQIITFDDPTVAFIGGGAFAGLPFSITIVLVVLALTALLTRRTAIGLFIEAVGNNLVASRYAGVNVRMVTFIVYVFSGVCSAVAGLIVAADIRAADANNAGLYLELDAILAVVIGGTALTGGRFYLIGSLVGALIIQTLTTTILTLGIPVEWTLVVKATVVLVVCLLQSDEFRRKVMPQRRVKKAVTA